jgi:low affinity Fe/Cu permease
VSVPGSVCLCVVLVCIFCGRLLRFYMPKGKVMINQ